jgi:hypothetical protein
MGVNHQRTMCVEQCPALACAAAAYNHGLYTVRCFERALHLVNYCFTVIMKVLTVVDIVGAYLSSCVYLGPLTISFTAMVSVGVFGHP